MDGTLLDGEGAIPDDLWPVLEIMRRRRIAFVPASGRQYATLKSMFDRAEFDRAELSRTELSGTDGHDDEAGRDANMAFIAENGAQLMRGGELLAASVIDPEYVALTLERVERLSAEGHDLGTVVCGTQGAYIHRDDDAFLAEVRTYYRRHRVVEDLSAVRDDVIKIAVYDFGDAEKGIYPRLRDANQNCAGHDQHGHGRADQAHRVVLSGKHWIDVSNTEATKGHALAQLQDILAIGPAQTAAFGDYLNDLDLFDHAELSYAMANSHPDLFDRARFVAPSNLDGGVVSTLKHLLALD
jgi:hydroxymethylpyrimidine pyrophosphatase-like HAD family hydrolase